ncbi:MAG: hypothetical protein ACRCY4_04950 [Brevinema sp.]
MSIIDDIYSVENLIEQIKSSGRQEIQEIYDMATKKEKELQAHFADTYAKESQEMEEEMAQRLAEYEASLREESNNPIEKLETTFQRQKNNIAAILIDNFWKK